MSISTIKKRNSKIANKNNSSWLIGWTRVNDQALDSIRTAKTSDATRRCARVEEEFPTRNAATFWAGLAKAAISYFLCAGIQKCYSRSTLNGTCRAGADLCRRHLNIQLFTLNSSLTIAHYLRRSRNYLPIIADFVPTKLLSSVSPLAFH